MIRFRLHSMDMEVNLTMLPTRTFAANQACVSISPPGSSPRIPIFGGIGSLAMTVVHGNA